MSVIWRLRGTRVCRFRKMVLWVTRLVGRRGADRAALGESGCGSCFLGTVRTARGTTARDSGPATKSSAFDVLFNAAAGPRPRSLGVDVAALPGLLLKRLLGKARRLGRRSLIGRPGRVERRNLFALVCHLCTGGAAVGPLRALGRRRSLVPAPAAVPGAGATRRPFSRRDAIDAAIEHDSPTHAGRRPAARVRRRRRHLRHAARARARMVEGGGAATVPGGARARR